MLYTNYMLAVLDNIRSVHNVGSIFRTADGAGFEKIYLCGVTPAPVDRLGRVRADFAKTALGAEKSIEWEYVSSAEKCLSRLKKDGWNIVILEQSRVAVMYSNLKIPKAVRKKTALVVGSETEGVPKRLFKYADKIVEIPMRGTKESLNVSVAFGIAAYRLTE